MVAQSNTAIEYDRQFTLESSEKRPTIHSPADAVVTVQYEISALE